MLRAGGTPAILNMIGDGPERRNLENLCTRMGLPSESIQFMGRIPYNELPEKVGRAWVNIHASVAEGWCFSIMEAKAAGTPTAGFEVPGVSDSSPSGSGCILVPDGNVPALVAAVREIMSNVATYSSQARTWAGRYPWDLAADTWRNVLEQAIADAS